MYGDTGVMRKRATQLREQGDDIRAMAELLVGQMDGIAWTGRAADSMRERIHERAAHLHDVAARHDLAADSLERHLVEVESLKERIATTEREADAPDAHLPSQFTPPPPGHKDWLTVELPGPS